MQKITINTLKTTNTVNENVNQLECNDIFLLFIFVIYI